MSAAVTDMDDIDTEAEKVSSKRESNSNAALAKAPDGKYRLTITAGEIKQFGTNNVKVVIKFALPVSETEMVNGEKDYWIKGKNGVDHDRINDLKADLVTFGADVDAWTPANMRPFTAELTKFMSIMPGIVVDGAKKNNVKNDKTYVNVYFNGRTKKEDGSMLDGFPALFDGATIAAAVEAAAKKPPF